MNEHDPSVTVIICCYTERRWELLSACVSEVSAQANQAGASVVLVVDHNPVLRARAAAAFPGSSITIVENRYAQGLSGARNTGVEATRADIVLFVDDDAVPQRGWLSSLRAAFDDPDLLAVGGEVRPVWPGTGERPPWLPPEFDWVVGCDYAGMAPLGAQVRNPIGANMGLRRDATVAVGGFRSVLGRRGTTPSGCEETDLAIRLRAADPAGGIRRIPGAVVLHHLEADRCTRRYLVRRCFAEGGSKAMLMRLEGASGALSAEADHALVAIPRAMGREAMAFARGDRAAAARICWTVLGLLAAVAGLARGLLFRDGAMAAVARQPDSLAVVPRSGPATESAPVWCVDADAGPSPAVVPATVPERVHVLVRADHRPLGQVELVPDPDADLHAQVFDAARRFRADQPAAPAPDWPVGDTSVSVVVCTLGRADSLATAVRAVLHAQTRPAHEVIVVDNDPASGSTRRALAGLDDPRLRVVEEFRRGVSWARNAGVAAATGAVVAFTDDDVAAEPDWVARLSEVFDADPGAEIGCVTGLVVPADLGLATHRWFEQSSGFERGFRPMVWEPGAGTAVLDRLRAYEPQAVRGRRGPAYPVAGSEFGSGNNMALRREIICAAGGFDTALGTGSPARGGEDLDVFRRVILGGCAIFYQPSAIVRHHHRATVAQLRKQMYDYGVGMCANVLRHATSGPRGLRETVRVLPGGLRLLLDPASDKNSGKTAGYPASLTWIELAGYVAGPAHLVRSARRARSISIRERRR
ncbi:glycosyltransferase family 2 protein [Nocardia sp. IBHARD005]|uniref:glycosyltransferase family 2 protein n=1 Tax=Nocardia sp. IBHARD005 TaxID=3457765 RepID=UPI004059CE0E